MALTITYDGFGVVANADSLTADTAGGAWAELGGGTISLNPDVYLYGSASIGSKYASKSGFTYFTATTALDMSVGGTEEGQYIYMWINIQSAGAFDVLANSGFFLFFGSDTSNYYKFRVAGSDDANGWSGGWKLFVLDKTLGEVVGTPVDTAIDTFGMWADTIVSVRADSIFQSQIMCAKGLKVEGTSTTMYDDIVDWCEDYTNRAAGMFQSRGQTYYSLGSLTVHSDTANTTVSAEGSNIEYEKSEFWNGTAWTTAYLTSANVITVEATGGNTCSLTDSSIGLSGNNINKAALVTTTATTYTKTGGYFKYLSGITLASGDSIDGSVITLSDAIKPAGSTLTNAVIGSTTETVTGALELAAATDLSVISNITFQDFSGKNALYIPSSVTGTITLNGFKSDGSGTDVYWDGADGTTLTINKAGGTDFTTWATPGTAIVSIVSSVDIDINVKDQSGANISAAFVYVDEDLVAAGNIANTTTDINGDVSTSYSGAATSATIRVRKYGYKPFITTVSLLANSATNVTLISDPQQT